MEYITKDTLPKHFPVKLIALDLDGTTLNKEKLISSRNKEVITRCMEKGIFVTLCTGRMFVSASHFLDQLNIKIPGIFYQGAYIADNSGNVLRDSIFTKEETLSILSFLMEQNCHINLYYGPLLYVNSYDEIVMQYNKAISLPETEEFENLYDLALSKDTGATKLVAMTTDDPVHGMDIYNKAIALYGDKYTITDSSPTFIEFGRADCTKFSGMEILTKYLGIDRENVLAIGDSPNDSDLLEFAKYKVAVKNGSEKLFGFADYITDTNENDGVALALEKLILEE